ncbi:MarR family transcriptional regulator [Microbacterium sp.]|uniref:MarR family winged helix-turn-helix transcriptional regulator n=1 Tax=Microbacterium sp. TaxID=51671 RepID=UPI00281196F0|nr:MarR family transcriptional regulator [Microbacterium sp.]
MSARTVSDMVLQLQMLSRAIEVQAAAHLEEAGTSLRNLSVLLCAVSGEKTQGELAELACLDKSTMVHTLDELERGGLASRKPAPHDRRARVVEVTDRGRELVAATEAQLDSIYESVLDRLPEADREPFLRSLSLLAANPIETPKTAVRAPRRRSTR